ncbi:hypothetical protein [Actinophytocola oryzae]|uniref:Uncharacterized protein n=1 Tax=Actinophytocola oryzae TaxID=502181 RepID=A0A4R7W6G5_9PSEU|nr:hypothetical protein [Actinophytocola oryzae]TDV57267.1 hypothetical protein CLV71_101138 [Actinophytocola oryzae]
MSSGLQAPHKKKRPNSPTHLRKKVTETPETTTTDTSPPVETETKDLKRKATEDPSPNLDSPDAVNKRQRITPPLTNSDRVRLDAENNPNRPAMEKIYKEFFTDDGTRKNSGKALTDQLAKLYKMMGDGDAEYARKPVTKDEFVSFLRTPDAVVNSQSLLFKNPNATQSTVERVERWRTKGDYFYVRNTKRKFPKAERRIAVNVQTQQAALKVSKSISGLHTDPEVGPFLKDHKIYLTAAPNPGDVKHDKLVAYYTPNPDAMDDDDTVGNRIAETIENAVDPDDVGGEFAPFYSHIGPHTAWGEEPEAFTESLKGSFTQSREQTIAKLIQADTSANVPDLQTFITRIASAFQGAYIDPDAPHTHLEK